MAKNNPTYQRPFRQENIKRLIDLYRHNQLRKNRDIDLENDDDIIILKTVRSLITDFCSALTQTRIESVHKTIGLPGQAPQLIDVNRQPPATLLQRRIQAINKAPPVLSRGRTFFAVLSCLVPPNRQLIGKLLSATDPPSTPVQTEDEPGGQQCNFQRSCISSCKEGHQRYKEYGEFLSSSRSPKAQQLCREKIFIMERIPTHSDSPKVQEIPEIFMELQSFHFEKVKKKMQKQYKSYLQRTHSSEKQYSRLEKKDIKNIEYGLNVFEKSDAPTRLTAQAEWFLLRRVFEELSKWFGLHNGPRAIRINALSLMVPLGKSLMLPTLELNPASTTEGETKKDKTDSGNTLVEVRNVVTGSNSTDNKTTFNSARVHNLPRPQKRKVFAINKKIDAYLHGESAELPQKNSKRAVQRKTRNSTIQQGFLSWLEEYDKVTESTVKFIIIAPKEKRQGRPTDRMCKVKAHTNSLLCPVQAYTIYKKKVAYLPCYNTHENYFSQRYNSLFRHVRYFLKPLSVDRISRIIKKITSICIKEESQIPKARAIGISKDSDVKITESIL
ncbi:hypothetical protein BB561_003433 [Smittium simulii]|uniref:Uncharacterized protein n=1 Tax=Smittium simulii TaxID=133385 RepID=A0A2T9YLG1_9FUNG|nr:hypothetical protein BB561_003433 [Smittium simulii]